VFGHAGAILRAAETALQFDEEARCAVDPLLITLAECCSDPRMHGRRRAQTVIEIGEAEGRPLWLAPEEMDYYLCQVGVLICQSAIGRRSERLCRCTE
jgi:hypothetical protein